MPEFENLEPFLDRDGSRIMPVAPHSTRAHDFVLRRREGRPARSARRPAGEAPDPAPVDGAERLTTQEMERAYRAAMKESRAKEKLQARRQGKTPWNRLKRWLLGLFTSAGGKNQSSKTQQGRRNRRKGAEAAGAKPERKRKKSLPQGGPDGQKEPAAARAGETKEPGKRAPQNRPRKRKAKRPAPVQQDGAGPSRQSGAPATQKARGDGASGGSGSGSGRPRRRRNRGSRGSGGKDASSSNSQQNSAE